MSFLKACSPALAFMWAGVSLGGNIVAAPAKFQVDTLTLVELLEVGRAQFAWLGWLETGLLLTIVVAHALGRQLPSWPISAACALFAIQQFYLQPVLQARTDALGSGHAVADSHAHLIFIAIEIVKLCCLITAGFLLMKEGRRR